LLSASAFVLPSIFDLPSLVKAKGETGSRRFPPLRQKAYFFFAAFFFPAFFLAFFLAAMVKISCEGVNALAIPRWIAGSQVRFRGPGYTASERLVKLKSRTLIDGITIDPPCSVPARRSAFPSVSKLLSMNNGDSLNRKFCAA